MEVSRVAFPENLAAVLRSGGAWLPFYFELRSRGDEEVDVDLEAWSGEIQGRRFFTSRRRVRLSSGAAPRRVWLYVCAPARPDWQEAGVRITAGGRPITGGNQGPFQIARRDLQAWRVIEVGGEEGDVPLSLVADLGRRQQFARLAVEVAADRLELHELPDSSLGYHAADAVVLRGADLDRLEPEQRKALRDWVFLGGFAVLAPGTSAAGIFQSELARELLGDRLGEVRRDPGFVPENLWLIEGNTGQIHVTGEGMGLPATARWTRFDPVASRAGLLRELRSSPWRGDVRTQREPAQRLPGALLYGEFSFGQGRVGVLTVNDQALPLGESAGFRLALWRALLPGAVRSTFEERAGETVQPEIARVLKDRKRDIGARFIASLIACYLLVVGPGTYFLLKRRNRLPAIVWVEPLVVVVALGAIVLTGSLIKGRLTKVFQVTLIHQRQGEPLALRESYFSVFPAAAGEYRVEAPRGELLKPLFANDHESQPVELRPAGGSAGGLELAGLYLDLWQEACVTSGVVEEMGAGVVLEARRPGGSAAPPVVAITNHLPWDVRFGQLRAGGSSFQVPPIPRGGQVEVSLEKPLQRWPSAFGDPEARELAGLVLEVSTALARAFLSPGSDRLLLAVLDRADEDFRHSWPASARRPGRLDIYLLEGPEMRGE